ncbi:MAG: hypothetical protein U1F41_15900 [Burkholderiales bacterium]
MEFDSWILLIGAFWFGSLVGFATCAMMQAAKRADAQRARRRPSFPLSADLHSDTVTRF